MRVRATLPTQLPKAFVIRIKLSNTILAILLGKDGTQMERAAILLASYNPSQLVGTLGLDGELVGKA
jgi:hypothetical protein